MIAHPTGYQSPFAFGSTLAAERSIRLGTTRQAPLQASCAAM